MKPWARGKWTCLAAGLLFGAACASWLQAAGSMSPDDLPGSYSAQVNGATLRLRLQPDGTWEADDTAGTYRGTWTLGFDAGAGIRVVMDRFPTGLGAGQPASQVRGVAAPIFEKSWHRVFACLGGDTVCLYKER